MPGGDIINYIVGGQATGMLFLWLWNRWLIDRMEKDEIRYDKQIDKAEGQAKDLTKQRDGWMRAALGGTTLARASITGEIDG